MPPLTDKNIEYQKSPITKTFASFVKITAIVFCVLIQIIICPRAEATNETPILNSALKTVKVGMFARDGYHNFDGDVPVSGYGFDYIQALRGYTNWKFQYSDKKYDWVDMFGLLESGKIDMLSGLIKTPEREKKFAYSTLPIGITSTIMTVKAGNSKFKKGDYAHWNGIRVGILDGAVKENHIKFAKDKGFVFTPVYYDTTDEILRDLQADRKIDAAITTDFRKLKNEWVLEEFEESNFYIAVRKSDKALLDELNNAMVALAKNNPNFQNTLRKKYYYAERDNKIYFTDAERNLIEQMQKSGIVLNVILNPDRRPISYTKNGEYRGGLKDIAELVSKRSGIKFRFVPSSDRVEYYYKVYEHPEVDIVLDFPYDFAKAGKHGFKLTKPYFTTFTSILHNKSLSRNFKSLALVEPSNEPKILNEFFVPNAKFIKCKTLAEAIDLICRGKCDAMYLHTRSAEYVVRRDSTGQLAVRFMPDMLNRYCLALKDSSNPLLFSILSKTIETIDNSDIVLAYLKNGAPLESQSAFEKFIVHYSFEVFFISLAVVLLLILFLGYVAYSRKLLKRTNSLIRLEISNWNALSKIANIYHFEYNCKTRQIWGNLPESIWPQKDGIAIFAKDCVHEKDIAKWRKLNNELIAGARRDFTITHRILRDGKVRYILVYMRKESPESDIVTGIAQEVTEIVETRERKDAAMRLWQTCIDSVPFMMFIKSAKDFRYLQCNESFAQFFSKKPNEILGKTDAELFGNYDDLAEKFRKGDMDVLASGKLVKVHESGIDHEGNHRYIMTVKVPTTDIDGNPIIVCISVDETEEYNRNIKLQNLIENRDLAAEMAKVVIYQVNFETMEMSGSKYLENYWPTKDGIALTFDEVVVPEDVERCREQYYAVASGKIKEAHFNYRRQKEDGIHYYCLHIRKDNFSKNSVTGLIVETTDFVKEKNRSDALTRLWNSVANSIPAILFVKDADDDYRYLYANENLAQIYNTTVEDVIGRNEKDFLSLSDAVRIAKSDIAAMKSDKPTDTYEIVRDANNIDHHYHSIKIPAVNEFGHRVMIQMTTDVTELQELSEVRKIVASAFEQLFFSENLEEGIRSVLKQVCEFVGFTRSFVVCINEENNEAKLFTRYIPSTEVPMLDDKKFKIPDVSNLEWYKRIMASEKGDTDDCNLTNPYDSERARFIYPKIYEEKEKFDIRGIHVHYLEVNGKPWGYVGFLTQYSDPKELSENERTLLNIAANIIELSITRKRSYVKLQKAMEAAKESARVKSNFLATMSHEIRTPLNAVLGFANLLSNVRLSPETHNEYLKNIIDSGNILHAMINDILDLSKLSVGKMKFTFTKTSLPKLVSALGVFFTIKCRAKGIVFNGAIPRNFPNIWVDVSRTRQILFNLLGNAVKFTNKGSVNVSAEFDKTGDENGTLRIIVRDTGIGISEEDLKHLFQPFSQANAIRGTATANNGTGLGLSICKKMLECMGGSLRVESEFGIGSTFTAEMKGVKYSYDSEVTEDKPIDIYARPVLKDYSKLSVLIVDDVKMNLAVLDAILRKLKISAVKATNADEALMALSKQKFDYVLTDLWMPGLNGAELAQRIRSEYGESSPHIVVVTADIEGKEHFDFGVFDSILTKPINALSIQDIFDSK